MLYFKCYSSVFGLRVALAFGLTSSVASVASTSTSFLAAFFLAATATIPSIKI
jgi:hypothetical protein